MTPHAALRIRVGFVFNFKSPACSYALWILPNSKKGRLCLFDVNKEWKALGKNYALFAPTRGVVDLSPAPPESTS
jgi:hypothetical protein